MRQIFKFVTGIIVPILAICGGFYGWLVWRYWSNPPKLTHNYAAELNAPVLKFPEAQRAWPIYREAVMALETEAPDAWHELHDFEKGAGDPEISRFVSSRENVLAKVRRAAQSPSLGFTLSDAETPEDARLTAVMRHKDPAAPSVLTRETKAPSGNPALLEVRDIPKNALRRLSLALRIDADTAARAGDGDRMTDDLTSLMDIAEQVREIPLVVHDAYSATLFDQALFAWGRLLMRHPDSFNDARLRRLEQAAMSVGGGNLQPRTAADRMLFYDALQRHYTDDGNGDGWFWIGKEQGSDDAKAVSFSVQLSAPLVVRQFPSRREAVEIYERLADLAEAQAALPLWEADFQDYEAQARSYNSERNKFVYLFILYLEGIHKTLENLVQCRDAMIAVAAMHRYRTATGKWPAGLDALTPDYLAQVPIDRRNGRPLGYRLTEHGPLVYSVGDDKDDDGGRVAFDAPTHGGRAHYWASAGRTPPADGDLILWPVAPTD